VVPGFEERKIIIFDAEVEREAGACTIVVAGSVVSTVQVTDVGTLCNVFRTESLPLTRNVCGPSVRPLKVIGVASGASTDQLPESSWNWYDEMPAPVTVISAFLMADGDEGTPERTASLAELLTLHVYTAGEGS
jgi:hypothetical protein